MHIGSEGLDVTIVGAGMILHDLILPCVYHQRRLGNVGRISVCGTRASSLKALRDNPEIAADAGVTLTVENFPELTSPFVTAADILEAVERIPGLKVTYDNGNAASGEEPAASFDRCAKHVAHAHFKDWDIVKVPTEGHREMLDGKFYRPALIGEGDVDQAACLRAMKAAGYEGYINIEYENNKYAPYEATRKAVEYLRSLENA